MPALLTQAQWAEKIRLMLPNWYFEDPNFQEAFTQGLALALATLQGDGYDLRDETFILEATGLFLDAHGEERNIERSEDELDPEYRPRVRNLANRSNCPAIKALVDDLLIQGEAQIVEDFNATIFCNRDAYLNRSTILITEIYNAFSILVEKQVHDPFSFMDREYFADREDFIGLAESKQQVFDSILESVNRVKACGVFYRIIELLES